MTNNDMDDRRQLMEHLKSLHTEDAGMHNFLVPASAYCRALGLIDKINELMRSEMKLQPGLVVQTMVLDTLSGRSPLYHLKEFVASIDTELLLGETVRPALFTDTNIGRSLDAIAAYGTGRLLTAVGVEAVKRFGLDPRVVSYDTTSTNVWGTYDGCEVAEGPVITHGYSKDHRPDLKQFMTELLCVDQGFPILGNTLDGNSSDKDSNGRILRDIAKLMQRHGLGEGAFIYIADSAMVTSQNLSVLGDTRFISRLPANYKACGAVIDEAVERDVWLDIGSLNAVPASKKRPPAVYKAAESHVTIADQEYRAVVIYSDALDRRRLSALERELATSKTELTEQLKGIPTRYACETDARQALALIERLKSKYHYAQAEIVTVSCRGRGRPSKNGDANCVNKYDVTVRIEPREDRVKARYVKAGCFVLLTNVSDTQLDACGILQAYKGQFAVEQNFAFLKDPLIVNDLFLKTPSRIDALGMILVIALMISRLMQRMMRRFIEVTHQQLPGWKEKQDTDRPTTYMLTWALRGIRVQAYKGQRFFLEPPNERQLRYLEGLGLDETVYLEPLVKCRPLIPDKTVQLGCGK